MNVALRAPAETTDKACEPLVDPMASVSPILRNSSGQGVVSVRIAAALAGVSINTIRAWLRRGYLTALAGVRPLRINLQRLEDLLQIKITDRDIMRALYAVDPGGRYRIGEKPPLYESPFNTRFHPDREAPHARG